MTKKEYLLKDAELRMKRQGTRVTDAKARLEQETIECEIIANEIEYIKSSKEE